MNTVNDLKFLEGKLNSLSEDYQRDIMMDDKDFYGLITFIFGIIGFLCSLIQIAILCFSMNTENSFGNSPYIFCSCVIMLCFICNKYLYKNNEKSKLSTIGSLLGILSIIPIILFLIIFFLVLIFGSFLINNYNPTIF